MSRDVSLTVGSIGGTPVSVPKTDLVGITDSITADKVTTTPGLFFALPSIPVDINTPGFKPFFAHWFAPFIISSDDRNGVTDSTEAYNRVYNNPDATTVIDTAGNTIAMFGGNFDTRPMPRPPKGTGYRLSDARLDCRQAYSVGINGFMPDFLGVTGENFTRNDLLFDAADAEFPDGRFKVVPMVDGNGATAGLTPTNLAAHLAQYANRPCSWMLPDGRMVCSIFKPDAKVGPGLDPTYWAQASTACQTNFGFAIAWIGACGNINLRTNFPTFYGMGAWGYSADPAIIDSSSNHATSIRAASQKYFAPITPEDVRKTGLGIDPAHGVYDNCVGTGALRAGCRKMIREDADFGELVTWSDHTETPAQPTPQNGWVHLQILAWYIAAWRNGGVFPTITRDEVILSHRTMKRSATITSPSQIYTMKQWPRTGMTTDLNVVEVVTYLTAAAQVTLTVGTNVYNYTATAGEFVFTAPEPASAIAANGIFVVVKRNNVEVCSVISPFKYDTTRYSDTHNYCRVSAIRGTSGQYFPQYQTATFPNSYTLAP